MSNEPLFPISVRFEGGEVETYSDVSHLECDLEVRTVARLDDA